jgi:hypothetical protein
MRRKILKRVYFDKRSKFYKLKKRLKSAERYGLNIKSLPSGKQNRRGKDCEQNKHTAQKVTKIFDRDKNKVSIKKETEKRVKAVIFRPSRRPGQNRQHRPLRSRPRPRPGVNFINQFRPKRFRDFFCKLQNYVQKLNPKILFKFTRQTEKQL